MIFGASDATGTFHSPAAKPVEEGDEERSLDAEMQSPTLGTHATDISMGTLGPSTHIFCPRKQKEQANPSQEDLCTQNTSIARRKCYEGRPEASASKQSKESAPKMDSDDDLDIFRRCVTLLVEIEPKLPEDNWFCAYVVLHDSPAERQGFLHMNGEYQ